MSQKQEFLSIKKITTKEGLSSPNVRKIWQDKYGFMWFATQDGLSRFDGVGFTNFTVNNRDDKKSLLSSDVFDIHFDKKGDHLWVLTAYGGLNKIDISTSSVTATYRLQESISDTSDNWFKCLTINDKEILIGSNKNTLIRFNTETNKLNYIRELSAGFNPEVHLDKLFVDSLKRVWLFFSNYGVVVKNKELSETIAFIPAALLTKGQGRIVFTDNSQLGEKLLITSSEGLKIISLTDFSIIDAETLISKKLSPLLQEPLAAISIKDKTIFITGRNGLFRINAESREVNKIIISKNYDDKEWVALSNSIYYSGKSIWLGSQYGIAWIKDVNTPFTGYYTSMNGSGARIEHSMTLLPVNDSILYVCSDVGIFKVNYTSSEIRRIGRKGIFFSIGKIGDDLFMASGVNGSLLLSGKEDVSAISSKFIELTLLESDALIDIRNIDDSIYFFASQLQKGLHVWYRKRKIVQTINTTSEKVTLKSNVINRVFIDSKKTVWIICDDVISNFNPYETTIEHLHLINPQNKQPLSINMDICELNNEYWVASYGTGIIRLNNTKQITRIYDSRDGIKNLGFYKIFSVNDSTIIASSNNGLSVLNIKTGKVTSYLEDDGLQSNNFEETSGSAYKDNLFFGGFNGFTKIDKRKFLVDNTHPLLLFNAAVIQTTGKNIDTAYLFIKKLYIPNNATLVTINFSSVNYSSPEKLQFEYRIKQKAGNWVSIGSSHEIPIIPLAPGVYHLQLRALNEAGNWSEPVELTLIFLPKWYQTWWFRTLVGLFLIAIGYALYRMRINQLKKEEKIRIQLANDLHDDLGSTLNSVKVYSNLAMMEKENTDYLIKVKESTQDAIAGVRDLIWVLDDKKDTMQDLLSKINQFAVPLCAANQINFIQKIDDGLYHYRLGKEEKRNLYMILKEFINNSIKYAACHTIEINATLAGKKLHITLSDDGKGFEKETVQEGNGLRNMANRAKEIHYKSTIISSPEKGTGIILQKN